MLPQHGIIEEIPMSQDAMLQPPCHMGDIIVRLNSSKLLLAKYLVLSDAQKVTKFVRSEAVWPNGDPLAFRFKLFVLYSSAFVEAEEPVGICINMWLHPDEIRVCQTLEASLGNSSLVSGT